MIVSQLRWSQDQGWSSPTNTAIFEKAQLVLAFGGIDTIGNPERYQELCERFPNANIVINSTAGEISASSVVDQTIVANAVAYEKTRIQPVAVDMNDIQDSQECGRQLAQTLLTDELNHVLILSDGGMVNGDALVKGLNEVLPENVVVTGGLAADAGRFQQTLVGLNEVPRSGQVVAIGHYGTALQVAHGSNGGWEEFGPIRTVTLVEGNKLMELDGIKALDLYKEYLGPMAEELPGSALRFPLSLYTADGKQVVRTILSIDEEEGSMTFAGDLPHGAEIRMMRASFERLIDGAADAAEASWHKDSRDDSPELVLMISCVGRKIVLDNRIGEEVEAVREIFGEDAVYTGFYSNGEISPVRAFMGCSLHNQTMTITTYSEQ